MYVTILNIAYVKSVFVVSHTYNVFILLQNKNALSPSSIKDSGNIISFFKLRQAEKASLPILFTPSSNTICSNFVHVSNALSPMYSTVLGIVSEPVKFKHLKNARSCILFTVLGIVNVPAIDVHSLNTPLSICVKYLGILILLLISVRANANLPSLLILSGINKFLIFLLYVNASIPMNLILSDNTNLLLKLHNLNALLSMCSTFLGTVKPFLNTVPRNASRLI